MLGTPEMEMNIAQVWGSPFLVCEEIRRFVLQYLTPDGEGFVMRVSSIAENQC